MLPEEIPFLSVAELSDYINKKEIALKNKSFLKNAINNFKNK